MCRWRGEWPSLWCIYLSAGIQLLTAAPGLKTKAIASINYMTDIVYWINIYINGRKITAWQGKQKHKMTNYPAGSNYSPTPLSVFTPTDLLRGSYTRCHIHTRVRAHIYTQSCTFTYSLATVWAWCMCPVVDLAKQRADVWHGAHASDSRLPPHCS